GEAGIGKSRLAEELATWVSRQGTRTAHTRAYAAEGALAYAPVAEWLAAESLRANWQGLDTVWLTELARIFPELLVEQPHVPPPAPMAESWQRKRLFEALARVLLVDNRPLLLVLDDLQWCDHETLEWLHYLLRYAPQAPLLVAGTVRPEEVSNEHPLTTLLLDLRSGGQVTELELGPLNLVETAALAAQVAGQTFAPDVGQRIYQETAGNPLFVVETVRTQLSGGDGEWGSGRKPASSPLLPDPSTSLPPRVYAVIQRRLLQLSPAAQALASLAAVVGRSFTFPVLAQASDLAEDTLVRGLDELWQRRIVRERGVEAYDFSHDRIRDVAYTTISLVHRRILHRRLAQALEIIHATNLDLVSGQVAVHYEQAGLLENAIQCYQQAAEVARRIGAYDEATAHLKHGLALLDTLPETAEHLQQAMTQLIMLGSVVSATQGHAALEVGEIYTKALELCQRVGDKVQTFAVRQGLRAFYGHRGAWTTAHQLAEENLALAQELDEPELLQYAHMGMGMVLHELGKHDLVQAHLKQVIHQSTTQPRHWDHL
ncbi:MAG: 6-hydroxy-D-nicotine oxidase, partial [Chloroflexi bacterium]